MSGVRRRCVYKLWERSDPNGPMLPKPPPDGKRTSNGIIWGHSIHDFYWIQRIPGVNVMTIWSRSMIQEFTEASRSADDDAEPSPRLRRPWPLLMLPPSVNCDPPLGIVDEGCDLGCTRIPSSIHTAEEGKSVTRVGSMTMSVDEKHVDTTDTAIDTQMEGIDLPVLITSELEDTMANGQSQPLPNQHQHEEQSNMHDSGLSREAMTQQAEIINNENLQGTAILEARDVDALHTLQETIPKEYFPDVLLVHDPNGITMGKHNEWSHARFMHNHADSPTNSDTPPIKYKRLFPRFERDNNSPTTANTNPPLSDVNTNSLSTPREAHLNLSRAPLLGVGHHSLVHRASLRLPPPLTTPSTGEVSVAAKISFPFASARDLLYNEARIYNTFPAYLMEEWCGLNLVSPIKDPVPVSAVVPKFYGYYVPVRENDMTDERKGKRKEIATEKNNEGLENEGHEDDKDRDGERRTWEPLSPILLLEECGSPIEPAGFSADDRAECYSLLLRLHYADFIQRSFYTRNVLSQPGPLTAPPSKRSKETPSFRIIDFGRAMYWKFFIEGDTGKKKDGKKKESDVDAMGRQWWNMRESEAREAQRELMMNEFEY